jgi:RNA polymerase sigma-70 factor (ECF subfamily)
MNASNRSRSCRGLVGEAEFIGLYRQYGAFALFRIQSIVRDRGAAEEILQEAMLSVSKHAHDFDASRGCLGTWFLKIVRNRALDHVRSKAFHISQHSVPASSGNRMSCCWILADLEEKERAEKVRAALQRLPEAQKTVIELSFFEDLSGSQIALKLGEPLGTVKTRMRAGLKNLRNQLLPRDTAFTLAA